MKDRIKQIREAAGVSQSEFAQKLNVSQAAVAQWEKGVKVPSASIVLLIAKEYGVNDKWLESGDGDMKRDFRDVQREIALAMFQQLSDDDQKAVNDVLEYYIKYGKSPYSNP